MFDSIVEFISDLTKETKHPSRFEDNDYQLAATALLIHAASIDGGITAVERDKLHSLIKQRFRLDDDAAAELEGKAAEAEHDAIDLYSFTSLLNRTMDQAGRQRLVEMMWEIVYADGRVSEFEDNLLWRAADLLQVSSDERIALRRCVAAAAANAKSSESA
jgi:uncharacterized tellurite resistance protein B-like protein